MASSSSAHTRVRDDLLAVEEECRIEHVRFRVRPRFGVKARGGQRGRLHDVALNAAALGLHGTRRTVQ